MAVPILMYHRIADISDDRNSLSPAKFAQQLQYLRDHGYHTISLQQLQNAAEPLPKRPVILTFDDGYQDNFRTALPLLLRYGLTATVFPVVGWIGQDNGWESYPGKPLCRMMTWEELLFWQQAGMEVGSHTVNHPFLSQLDETQIWSELLVSKEQLEKQLGTSITTLCYPYGDFDERVKRIAHEVGYKAAVAIFAGTSFWRWDELALPRLVIASRQPLWEFRWKVSPVHRLFTALRLAEKSIKTYLRN